MRSFRITVRVTLEVKHLCVRLFECTKYKAYRPVGKRILINKKPFTHSFPFSPRFRGQEGHQVFHPNFELAIC